MKIEIVFFFTFIWFVNISIHFGKCLRNVDTQHPSKIHLKNQKSFIETPNNNTSYNTRNIKYDKVQTYIYIYKQTYLQETFEK